MFSNKPRNVTKFSIFVEQNFEFDDSQIESFSTNLQQPSHKLIRIGEKNDGGYLIPDIQRLNIVFQLV